MRILHVLGKLDRGGVETWLVQLLSHIDRERYAMDFLVHTEEPGVYDQEVLATGARIIPCLQTRSPLAYRRNFLRILREFGPYDCVHSHVQYYSGYVLLLARMAGVPTRIAHTHTADPELDANLVRHLYRAGMRQLIQWNANAGIAVSHLAGDALIPTWKSDSRWHLIPYGVDTSRFAVTIDRSQIRRELGIPDGKWVIGHVGRFVDVKNHAYMIQVAKVLCARDQNCAFPACRRRATATGNRGATRGCQPDCAVYFCGTSGGCAPGTPGGDGRLPLPLQVRGLADSSHGSAACGPTLRGFGRRDSGSRPESRHGEMDVAVAATRGMGERTTRDGAAFPSARRCR